MEVLDDEPLTYPDSDGRPLADNTEQFRWIAILQGNLDALLDDFVAGDLLWYPVQARPRIRMAPDVLVALGRPKGARGSYKQWEEEGIAPSVVFEVLSPGNSAAEMVDKRAWYERYGALEYYVVDPEIEVLEVFVRSNEGLVEVPFDGSFTSPLLGIRFVRHSERLTVHHPDDRPFLTFAELRQERDASEAERRQVTARLEVAEAERRQVAAQRDAAEVRAARLAARLRALGIDPDTP